MDKEEFRIKLDQINHLVEVKDYKGAMEVVDSIDWRRVKNVRTLCVVGEIYAANKRYEDSRDIFLLAYHRASIGKNILYRLVEVSLKMGDIEGAMDYYEEFCSVAPNDNTAYVLRYKILSARNAPIEDQIQVLEEYKSREFTEKWSYELAKLYYRAGDKDKSEEICNEMILWFSEGNYVMKAYDLKMKMGVMTDKEKEKYEKSFAAKPEKDHKEESSEDKKNGKENEEINEKSSSVIEETVIERREPQEEKTETSGKSAEKEEPEEYVSVVEVHHTDHHPNEEELLEKPGQDEENEASEDIREKTSEESTGDEDTGEEDIREGESFEEENLEEEEDLEKDNSEEAFEDGSEEAAADDGSPVIESIRIRNDRDLDGAETFSEKFTKGLRGFFGGLKKTDSREDMEEEEPEEEEFLESEQDDELEEIYDEETDPEEEEDPETVKKEGKKKEFRFPEFRIPRSMKKNNNPEEEGEEAEPEEEFNLEDTILAAASAQGIKIPGSEFAEKQEESEKSEEDFSEEEKEKEDKPEESESGEKQEEADSEEESSEDEMIIMDQMIDSETEKSLISLEKSIRAPVSEDKEDQGENVPDLIMPDLTSLLEEELEEEVITSENDEDISIESQDFIAEIIAEDDDVEDSDEEEEFLITGVIEQEKEEPEEKEPEEKVLNIPVRIPDPVDIRMRGKDLTEDEIKLFSYFVKVPGMKEQIVDALTDIQIQASEKTSNSGNIIVMGGPESGKTRLISGLVPAICKELQLEAAKVAYVFADQINGKNITNIVSKLSGGFLVIENANQLDQETAANLAKAMEGDTNGMIFILEDDKIGMRKMMARYPKLARKFTSVINIPVFTNDELANFAKIYAMENGYRIDNMGMLALYNLISINQKEDVPMNIGSVKVIVDAAIAKSQGGIKVFRKNAEKKRLDQDGFITLYEKDFVKGK